MNELTEEEKTVCDLAISQMQERGEKFHPILIATHALGETCIYFVFGNLICGVCGGTHTDAHLLYMRLHGGYTAIPVRDTKQIAGSPRGERNIFVETLKALLDEGGQDE